MFHPVGPSTLGATRKSDNRPIGQMFTTRNVLAGAAQPFNSAPVSLPYETWAKANTQGGSFVFFTGY